ncbi:MULTISPECIES: SGNH/GDSL hydrolase family protein [unclassified Streptomyces]|uniref:SGNH/GDSL hydrolase family protein n=1 Tax=unclassified Streptomyces TaxID=2593676 RepID=UPI00403D2F71
MMKTSVQAGVAGLLACGTLLTVVLVTRDGDGTHPGIAYSAPAKGPYVALGDSYTAGPGITDPTGTPAGCDRSAGNYPALVAAELGLKGGDFHDVSCDGATTTDLTSAQRTVDGTNSPQLRALSSATRLVTLGIGGNDIGFGSMIKRCVAMGALYRLTGSGEYLAENAPCARAYVNGDSDEVRAKIATAADRLTRVLTEVKRRAPEARVYVVSYPAILPSDGAGCGREMSLAPGDVTFLREKEQQLNSMLRQRASDAKVAYVDTYTPSVGHDACTAKDTRWIEPLTPENPAAPVHPNARGERGMADAVLRAIKSAL